MNPIRYTVRAECPDEATARDFIAWLAGGHIAEVIKHGASDARIIRLNDDASGTPGTPVVLIEYSFPSRAAYDEYDRDHAPALRAEGRVKFVEGRGVKMSRMIGEIAQSFPERQPPTGERPGGRYV